MNYRYKIGGEDFILSHDEHEKITKGVKEGKSQFWLRGGTMMINLALAWLVTPTQILTSEQEKEKEKILRLEAPRYTPPTAEDLARREKMSGKWKRSFGKPMEKSAVEE